MRLNWFAEPVVFFSSLLFLVAAQIFTMRPKLDDTTARQTCELANLGVTTVTAHPGRRVQGRWPRTTNTRPGGGVILPVEKNPLGWRSLTDANMTVR